MARVKAHERSPSFSLLSGSNLGDSSENQFDTAMTSLVTASSEGGEKCDLMEKRGDKYEIIRMRNNI